MGVTGIGSVVFEDLPQHRDSSLARSATICKRALFCSCGRGSVGGHARRASARDDERVSRSDGRGTVEWRSLFVPSESEDLHDRIREGPTVAARIRHDRCPLLLAQAERRYSDRAPPSVVELVRSSTDVDIGPRLLQPAGEQHSQRRRRRCCRDCSNSIARAVASATHGHRDDARVRRQVGQRVRAFGAPMGCQCDGHSGRLDCRESAIFGDRLSCSHLARHSECGMSRRATAPAMAFSTVNITRPSAAPEMMYSGHGPITFSSELWIGLLRRYM